MFPLPKPAVAAGTVSVFVLINVPMPSFPAISLVVTFISYSVSWSNPSCSSFTNLVNV